MPACTRYPLRKGCASTQHEMGREKDDCWRRRKPSRVRKCASKHAELQGALPGRLSARCGGVLIGLGADGWGPVCLSRPRKPFRAPIPPPDAPALSELMLASTGSAGTETHNSVQYVCMGVKTSRDGPFHGLPPFLHTSSTGVEECHVGSSDRRPGLGMGGAQLLQGQWKQGTCPAAASWLPPPAADGGSAVRPA